MKILAIISALFILSSCSKYRDYANEAIRRYCPPEIQTKIVESINACTAAASNGGQSALSKDECFAYVAVTFCPPISNGI